MVYYVEDDTNIREITLYALTQAGIDAQGFSNDAAFRRACDDRIPDAVLLDIMLPDTDGISILRVSRVRALLRRSGRTRSKASASDDTIEVGPLRISAARREAGVDGRDLQLTMREFDLLEFLAKSPGVVF